MGLPLLEAFLPRDANAQTVRSPFVLIVVNGNGVVQAGRDIVGGQDPEMFWPTRTGTLTTAALEADKATRTTGELAAQASKLTFVRGISHPFAATGCMHASGDLQVLTASRPVGNSNQALATGESIDSVIAREKNLPGRDPLVLHAGKYAPGGTGFDIPGYVSYIGRSQPRPYIDSAYKAYQRIVQAVGTGNGATAAEVEAQRLLATRSKSINDLLRGEIQTLLARTDLSSGDRRRLDQHFSAIRDIEIGIATSTVTPPPATSIASMQAIDPRPYDVANHEALIRLHMELMAFAIAADYTRVAVLKIGDREDDHQLTLNGTTFVFHTASHRAIANGASLCHQVDRLHARYFLELVNRLATTQTTTGPLLDQGVTVWTNQVANGSHSFQNVPWILAGSANGYLKTGTFVQVTHQTNRMLNTLLTAAGVARTNFGDASLTAGVVPEILA
ncbi:MAG TPA: DUF1552 domain-containing protein [Polyangiaceae bacterium]|nr:DUF1552 domain-containing protein [Polyangiaceae bacterium]